MSPRRSAMGDQRSATSAASRPGLSGREARLVPNHA